MSYAIDYPIASQAAETERAGFIRRTYGHLAGAILAFVGLEFALLQVPGIERVAMGMLNMWFLVIVAMIGAGWIARYWAQSNSSPAMQYMGLGLYVVAEVLIFLPLLYICTAFVPNSQNLIATAGVLTLALFGGLTVSVFITGKDFSFMGPALTCAGFIALGFIACSMIFGFSLGLVFSFAMVALSCGYILYDTSNIMRHYRTDQHVGAALELFAAVALMFWYIIQILMSVSSRD